jgi:cellobiose phosphorylase
LSHTFEEIYENDYELESRRVAMKYGHFDDDRREYIIETPHTPLPWINYLGTEGFFSIISNVGTGYSFYKDAKLRRITRFRYNSPSDQGGRNYYLKEGSDIWSPCFLPSKTELDSYVCHCGLGYNLYESSKNKLYSSLLCFVPLHENCEINMLVLRNDSDSTKTVQLFAEVEWCLWNAVDDSTNFQRNYNIGEVEIEQSTIYHKTEYRERRNHYAFYSVNSPITGFDSDRDSFLGPNNGYQCPDAVRKGCCSSSIASGWAPVAATQIDLTLKPGETRSFIYVLGYIENSEDEKFSALGVINKQKAHRLISCFDSSDKVNEAFKALESYWNDILGRFQVHSACKKTDRMLNIWNQYQCLITFCMSRSASFFESGIGRGMGFRDSCQDLLGCVHMIPELTRQRILDIAAIQSEDGSTFHQYQPLTKTGNADVGSGFNDDPLWLVACTTAYIKETGDSSILDEAIQFSNTAESEKPLMEHLRRSIGFTISHKGPEGLPLIGRADWNDCLNLNCFSTVPGESFQTCSNKDTGRAESVFIAGMFVKYGREYAELCSRFGSKDESDRILLEVEKMEQAVIANGWDGKWFLRAYDAFGAKVGSSHNAEAKIFIEPQGFCSMAGIGMDLGLPKKALESVKEYLLCDYGVCLLSPCYTEYHPELGEISSYPPGYKENGSIFCHNNNWVALAFSEMGDGDDAFDIYRRTCPAFIEESSDIHRSEPYVYCQTIAGPDAARYGEAKNSWLTGTAAWAMVTISQGIFGIRPDFDGLQIKPCLPKDIDSFKVSRLFRGTRYEIQVKKATNGEKPCMTVDGFTVEGNLIKCRTGQKLCKVKAII